MRNAKDPNDIASDAKWNIDQLLDLCNDKDTRIEELEKENERLQGELEELRNQQ